MDAKKATMLAAICGAVILIGVLLPWYSIAVPGFTLSFNGTEGPYNGGFILVLGVIAGLAAAFLWRGAPKALPLSSRGLALIAVGGFGLATLVTLIDVSRSMGNFSGMRGSEVGFSAGRGAGMFITLLAAAAGAGLSFLALRGTSPGATPPAPPAS
jgi:hypothetical protein